MLIIYEPMLLPGVYLLIYDQSLNQTIARTKTHSARPPTARRRSNSGGKLFPAEERNEPFGSRGAGRKTRGAAPEILKRPRSYRWHALITGSSSLLCHIQKSRSQWWWWWCSPPPSPSSSSYHTRYGFLLPVQHVHTDIHLLKLRLPPYPPTHTHTH